MGLHTVLSHPHQAGSIEPALDGVDQALRGEQLREQAQAVWDGVGDLGDGVLRHPVLTVGPGIPGNYALCHVLAGSGFNGFSGSHLVGRSLAYWEM